MGLGVVLVVTTANTYTALLRARCSPQAGTIQSLNSPRRRVLVTPTSEGQLRSRRVSRLPLAICYLVSGRVGTGTDGLARAVLLPVRLRPLSGQEARSAAPPADLFSLNCPHLQLLDPLS